MSVAWDAGGKLGLRVYSVTAGPVSQAPDRWHLHLGDSFPELQQQLLSRTVPRKLDMAWLLSESLVASGLSAGMAGFPPQLDLLLSPQPLSRLIDVNAVVKFEGSGSIAGRSCSRVSVVHRELAYQMWIDQQENILRRLELPSQLIPEAILQDNKISEPELSIEFAEVELDSVVDWSDFQIVTTESSLLVSRFVAPPALPAQAVVLGMQCPAFSLHNHHGEKVFQFQSVPESSNRNLPRAIVLMWLADHPACYAAAEQIASMEKQLQSAGYKAQDVQVVSIWAEGHPPEGVSFDRLQSQWQLPGTFALDRAAAGRDLFKIDEAPTIVVLNQRGIVQFIDVRLNPDLDRALTPIVARVIDGHDVAGELIESLESAQQRYRVELALAASEDATSSQVKNLTDHQPEFLRLTKVHSRHFSERVIAMAQDSNQSTWVVLKDGKLIQLDNQLQDLKTLQLSSEISKKAGEKSEFRLHPSPDGQYLALQSESGGLEILLAHSGQSQLYPIPQVSRVRDVCWLAMENQREYRLAMATDLQQILLVDPKNREQLSGKCLKQPVAIVALDATGDSVQGVTVMEDGSIETLRLGKDFSAGRIETSMGVARRTAAEKLVAQQARATALAFTPLRGDWKSHVASSSTETEILAWGVSLTGEPCAFFLNQHMHTNWHYPLPLNVSSHRASRKDRALNLAEQQASVRSCVALSPTNGKPIWAILDTSGTVHLIRRDLRWSDHFKPSAEVFEIGLQAVGDRIHLVLATAHEIETWQVD